MTQMYKDPVGGNASSIGSQIRTDYFKKKALIEESREMYFQQMADSTTMPKHYGKEIRCYHYLPLLSDANVNDQGIDANGIIADGTLGTLKVTIETTLPGRTTTGNGWVTVYGIGEATTAADALAAAQIDALIVINEAGETTYGSFAAAKADIIDNGGTVTGDDAALAVPNTGNLYGSSKDIGTITGKLPLLSETGGRVNRVGFKRIDLKSNLQKLGYFDEYTQESLDFDSDKDLRMHINREMLRAANEITEDMLQIDIINAAGVVRYGGAATNDGAVTAEGGTVSELSYEDFMRLAIDLDDNRCPKMTTIIEGSRMIDTRVVNAARYMYIGTELEIFVKQLKDGVDKVFIPVAQYASAGNVARGEIGAIDNFRIIVVPEMLHWEGAGAPVGTNPGYRSGIAPAESANAGTECYNVYPMLVIGSGSFTTVGFKTSGSNGKFEIFHKPPGRDIADLNDPYGEVGFMSIKWYYGFMVLRPERIALGKVVAKW